MVTLARVQNKKEVQPLTLLGELNWPVKNILIPEEE